MRPWERGGSRVSHEDTHLMNEKRITNPDHTSPRRTLNVYHLHSVLLLLETTWVVPTSVVQCTCRSTSEVLVEYDPVVVGYTTHHIYRILSSLSPYQSAV